MERWLLIFVALLSNSALQTSSAKRTSPVTPNVRERIEILKQEILEEIQETRHKSKHGKALADKPNLRQLPIDISEESESEDSAEYVVPEDTGPITPIPETHKRKKKDRFKFRKIKTTTPEAVENEEDTKKILRHRAVKPRSSKAPEPLDIFYRRNWYEKSADEEVPWTHCQDLITPFINGQKKDITAIKRVTANDEVVQRLVFLLNMNTTGATRDEVYSLLYQISNLQLRFFQWDIAALKLLTYTITKRNKTTFKSLKNGMKAFFARWHMNFGDITALIKQTRIFRPPCIRITEYGGSTQSSHGVIYSKPTTPKRTCQTNEYSDECVLVTIKY